MKYESTEVAKQQAYMMFPWGGKVEHVLEAVSLGTSLLFDINRRKICMVEDPQAEPASLLHRHRAGPGRRPTNGKEAR